MPEQNYIIREVAEGTVNISEEVLATIAAQAVREVDGVGGFATTLGGEIAERLGKRAPSRGVKLVVEGEEVTVDAFILIKYGSVIGDVSRAVQDAVTSGIEAMTGITVNAVNVTVCGVAFGKKK